MLVVTLVTRLRCCTDPTLYDLHCLAHLLQPSVIDANSGVDLGLLFGWLLLRFGRLVGVTVWTTVTLVTLPRCLRFTVILTAGYVGSPPLVC